MVGALYRPPRAYLTEVSADGCGSPNGITLDQTITITITRRFIATIECRHILPPLKPRDTQWLCRNLSDCLVHLTNNRDYRAANSHRPMPTSQTFDMGNTFDERTRHFRALPWHGRPSDTRSEHNYAFQMAKLPRSKISVGVNVGVFFRYEKAQPFQIGLSH
jgi:hypothetical protein